MLRVVLASAAMLVFALYCKEGFANPSPSSQSLRCDGTQRVIEDLRTAVLSHGSPTGVGPWTLTITGVKADEIDESFDSTMVVEPSAAFSVTRVAPLEFSVSIADANALLDLDRDLVDISCKGIVSRKAVGKVAIQGTGASSCHVKAQFVPTGDNQPRPIEQLQNEGRTKFSFKCQSQGDSQATPCEPPDVKIAGFQGTEVLLERKTGDISRVILHLDLLKQSGAYVEAGDVVLKVCSEAPEFPAAPESSAPESNVSPSAPPATQPITVGNCIPRYSKQCVGRQVKWFDSCGVEGELVVECRDTSDCMDGKCMCKRNVRLDCVENDKNVWWINGCNRPQEIAETCNYGFECSDGACSPCRHRAEKSCINEDKNVWWFDSCGNAEEMAERCDDKLYTRCVNSECQTECRSRTSKQCRGGDKNVWWFNSCGQVESMAERCDSRSSCQNGLCRVSCTQRDEKRCVGKTVYWYDSCGAQGERVERCSYDEECEDGECIEEDEEEEEDARWCCQPNGLRVCKLITSLSVGSSCYCTGLYGYGIACR